MATVEELKEELAQYKEAKKRILYAQEYNIEGRSVRRPDLKTIEEEIQKLESRIRMAENGGRINTQQAVFGGKRG